MKVIIVGGGQVGSYIAKLLLANENEVYIVENREKVLAHLSLEFPKQVIKNGSGSDSSVLEELGIDSCDAVVAVTGADEVNLVVSTLAKYEYGVNRVIARVNNPRNAWLFDLRMGVDVVVNQADLLSRIVTDEIDMKSLTTLLKVNHGKHSIIQIGVSENSKTVGVEVKDLNLPNETILIALIRDGEVIVINGTTLIQANDTVIAMTNAPGQYELHDIFG